MAESNILIINELKIFLDEVSETKSLRKQYCTSSTSFVRKRILSFKVLAVMILNMMKRSLSIEIQDFFEHLHCQYSCSKQAFSARHKKFNPQFFYTWQNVFIVITTIIKDGKESVSLTYLKNELLEDVLLLFDRGCPSFWLIYILLQRKEHFVMRVQKNANKQVSHFLICLITIFILWMI